MPIVESTVRVPIDPATAFGVSQTTGRTRLRWDPFIREQHLLDGARRPGKGVRTSTRHRLGFVMISRYVSFAPPRNVGMTMEQGPWFLRTFAGGWRFEAAPPGPDGEPRCDAVWRYSFTTRPAWLRPVAERIGVWVLGRDIEGRIAGFAQGCEDPEVLTVVRGNGPADRDA